MIEEEKNENAFSDLVSDKADNNTIKAGPAELSLSPNELVSFVLAYRYSEFDVHTISKIQASLENTYAEKVNKISSWILAGFIHLVVTRKSPDRLIYEGRSSANILKARAEKFFGSLGEVLRSQAEHLSSKSRSPFRIAHNQKFHIYIGNEDISDEEITLRKMLGVPLPDKDKNGKTPIYKSHFAPLASEKHEEIINYSSAYLDFNNEIVENIGENLYTLEVDSKIECFELAIEAASNLKPENARALSVLFAETTRIKEQQQAFPLPQKAPELYEKRKDKSENAIQFLDRVWGAYIQNDAIYRDELNALDPKIIQAVRNYCFTKPELDVDKILPKDPYYRYLNILRVSHPDSQEFAEATIKIAERLKKNRQKSQNIKNAK